MVGPARGVQAQVERRTIPGETGEDAVEELEELAEEISSVDREFSVRVTKFFEQSPMEVSPEEEVVRCVAASYKGLMGVPPAFVGVPYWTDAALLMNGARIPTCVFGPGDIRLAHSEDEYVEVDEVAMGVTIFASTMLHFAGRSNVSPRGDPFQPSVVRGPSRGVGAPLLPAVAAGPAGTLAPAPRPGGGPRSPPAPTAVPS